LYMKDWDNMLERELLSKVTLPHLAPKTSERKVAQ